MHDSATDVIAGTSIQASGVRRRADDYVHHY